MNVENTKVVKPDENQNTAQTVDKSRRSFAKVGAVAPVIMTLASQPVFGVQCLSSRMSGNLSNPNHGFNCWGGMSPGFWQTPAGKPYLSTQKSEDWEWAWGRTGYSYGYPDPTKRHASNWDDYIGGTDVRDGDFSFFMSGYVIPSTGNKAVRDVDKDGYISIRELLNQIDNSDAIKTLFCGWLNMKYFKSFNDPADNYFIKNEADFINMYNTNKDLLITLIAQYEDKTPNDHF